MARDGKLTLLAADHPARMVNAIRDDKNRMADRREFLARIARAMASSFDGLLGTSDVVDELLMLEKLTAGKGISLHRRVVLGSVNRGGLAGTVFEMDDKITGYDADGILRMRLDGAKFLLRFDPEDEATSKTLEYCVRTVRECDAKGIPIFVEPLPVVRKDGKVKLDSDRDRLLNLVGVVSGFGSASTRLWLKLPYCEGFEKVAAATTLPILMLGGEAGDDVTKLLAEVQSGMRAGSNVRGVLMGRNLLYPPGDDPLPLANAIHSMVHEGTSAKLAETQMEILEGK